MSNAQLTINGGANGHTGVVTVPSSFVGAASVSGSINNLLQNYLNGVAGLVNGGSVGLDNNDFGASQDFSIAGSGSALFQEITDTDSTGAASGSSINAANLFPLPNANSLVVEAPGNETITGDNGSSGVPVNFALFGQNSNVDYTVVNGAPSSIFAAGGADSITLLNDGATQNFLNDSIWSAGNDTMNLFGQGSVNANSEAGATDSYLVDDSNASITASGNATVTVHWRDNNAGGTLDFVNNSTVPATVYSSVFADSLTASTHVTAYGGQGGGWFNGGQGDGGLPNFLVGGAVGSVSINASGNVVQVSADSTVGAVTLIGAASGDLLDAQSAQKNYLYAGAGAESLIAASSTGSNFFQMGLTYHGLGHAPSDGVISTQGSGAQDYFFGNSEGATIYGSQALGATNTYYFVGDSTTGGGVFTIENFSSANSSISLINGTDSGAGDASVSGIFADPFNSGNTLIGLSDGTRITLVGVNHSSVTTVAGGSGITKIV